MPFNGDGTFIREHNWVTDKANSIKITASRCDAEDNGFATGLSNCITKDGQTTISANIPFNSKKITGLSNGSARTDSIALGQVQDNTYGTLGTLGGSANTYTAAPSPAITTYATGSRYILKVNADNTGASTLNISAVGAKNIKKYDGAGAKVDVEAADLQQDQYYDVFYDGTDFVVDTSVPASTSAPGHVELSTDAEAKTMTDTGRAVTPSNLSAVAASQSDQETGTSNTRFVTPGVQHYHVSAAKFWCNFDGSSGSGTITPRTSYNVDNITDNGTGDYTINITNDFSSANYVTLCTVGRGVINNDIVGGIHHATSPAAGSVRVFSIAASDYNTALDAIQYNVVGYGDL